MSQSSNCACTGTPQVATGDRAILPKGGQDDSHLRHGKKVRGARNLDHHEGHGVRGLQVSSRGRVPRWYLRRLSDGIPQRRGL